VDTESDDFRAGKGEPDSERDKPARNGPEPGDTRDLREGEIQPDPEQVKKDYGTRGVEPDEIVSTVNLGDVPIDHQLHLVVVIRGTDERFVYEVDKVEELIMGRADPASDDKPDIDLTNFQAIEKGVSRRHAAIKRKSTILNVVDLKSPNGTYLNGKKLFPNQARLVRDGDEIRLGNLVLTVHFEKVPAPLT
jgi:hypothetical protein